MESSSLSVAKTKDDISTVTPVFYALMVVGLFIKFSLSDVTLSEDGTTGPATSLIWGYGLVVFSLLGLIIINVNPGSNEWNDIVNLPWSIIVTIALMIWTIVINIQYYTQINKKNVPDEYILWSKYSTVLLACLIGITLYQHMMMSSSSKNAKAVAESLYLYVGITFVFNVIAVSIQQVILSCFYVDG